MAKKTVKQQVPVFDTEKKSECFRCDGTGKICNICGEAPQACGCSSEDIDQYVSDMENDQFDPCEDCKGTGR